MRAAVLGSPVAHSLSPVLHTAAYTALGIADRWRYEWHECTEDALAGFLTGLAGGTGDDAWAGLSLTMPLKRAAMALADDVDPLAVQVGGANTLVLRDGRRSAYNTDVGGIVAALREAGVTRVRTAVILGGGATAASALAAVRELGATADGAVTALVRSLARTGELTAAARRMGAVVPVAELDAPDGVAGLTAGLGADLVVSTLPSGAADRFAPQLAKSGIPLFDVVYAPWPTVAGTAVAEAGGTVIGGFPMLLHQAARQVELMTGVPRAPVEAMRAAGVAELDRRAAARAHDSGAGGVEDPPPAGRVGHRT